MLTLCALCSQGEGLAFRWFYDVSHDRYSMDLNTDEDYARVLQRLGMAPLAASAPEAALVV